VQSRSDLDRAAADVEETIVFVLVTADGDGCAVGTLASANAGDGVAGDADLASDTVEEVAKTELAERIMGVGSILDVFTALKRTSPTLTDIPG